MKQVITAVLFIFTLSAFSQRTCATNEKLQELKNTVPGFTERHNELMTFIRNPNQQNIFNKPNAPTIIVTVPVVFHVLYKNATENISDAQIASQLQVLNNDFRKLNSDFSTVVPAAFQSLAGDMEIVFCKATRTPTGQASNGITRKSVGNSFNFGNSYFAASGEPAWDPTKYLNIWIGNFSDNQLLGFAYLPDSAGQPFDGLCISYKYFGTTGTATAPFNKGRTATHEIGHYFGLYHPWGEDGSPCNSTANDDGVSDTPATKDPYFTCPSFPANSQACSSTPNGSMFMNYMDYVNDACMAMFSNGQKLIMQNTLAGPRASLLTSNNGCATLSLSSFDAVDAITLYPNPASQYISISSLQLQIDEVEIYNAAGQFVKSQKLEQTNTVIKVDSLPIGIYYLRIYNQGSFVKSDKLIKI